MEFLRCYRCGNVWRPRRARVNICPLCKSRLWNVPRPAVVPPFDPLNRAWNALVVPHREEILRIAHRHHAKNVRVFGSVRRGDAQRDSDLDLLVTMETGSGILDQVALRRELARALHRRVDVVADDSIFWLLENQIRSEAIPL